MAHCQNITCVHESCNQLLIYWHYIVSWVFFILIIFWLSVILITWFSWETDQHFPGVFILTTMFICFLHYVILLSQTEYPFLFVVYTFCFFCPALIYFWFYTGIMTDGEIYENKLSISYMLWSYENCILLLLILNDIVCSQLLPKMSVIHRWMVMCTAK